MRNGVDSIARFKYFACFALVLGGLNTKGVVMLSGIFRRRAAPEHEAIVRRYKAAREATSRICSEILKRSASRVLDEAARRLKMRHGSKVVFGSESEMAVLMDYALFDVRHKGQNLIERELDKSRLPADAFDRTCLEAMGRATYSVFKVESIERCCGVRAADLRTGESHLIVDLGFASSGRKGLALAMRLFHHDGFAMCSGAAIPIGYLGGRDQATADILLTEITSDRDGHLDPAPLIRKLLQQGRGDRISYETPVGFPNVN
jgi:hypothetical protein